MFKNIKRKLFNSNIIVSYFSKYNSLISYSQYGEDKILDFAFKILKNKGIVDYGNYLDVGGCFPYSTSNTFFLYQKGYKGVVIEAQPELAEQFKKFRKRDIVLNIGVCADENEKSLPF